MDVNGTRFHLLLGQADWEACAAEPEGGAPGVDPEGLAEPANGEPFVAWDGRRLALTLWRRVFQFATPPGPKLDPAARRGAARDRFGNWYWIDETEQRILVSSAGSGETTVFWPLEDPSSDKSAPAAGSFRSRDPAPSPPIEHLSGLAVTGHHRLVVGTLAPPGLLAFDLQAGGPPEHLLWPGSFAPFDMSATADGGLVILERGSRAMWALDCHLKVIRRAPPAIEQETDDFKNRDGSARVPPRQRVPIGPVALSAADPIAIEALGDGTVLILDREPDVARPASSAVRRYRFDEELGGPVFLDVMKERADPASPAPLDFVAHDIAVAGGRLFAASRGGAQAFAFDLEIHADSFELKPSADYLPMRFFGGKAIVAAGGRVFYDFSDGWIDLVEQPRDRFRSNAVVTTPILDGKEPGCVWHRLILDACIPVAAGLEVWSRASDEREDLAKNRVAWSREPSLSLRPEGPEIPFAPRIAPAAEGPPKPGDGTWELLIQRAKGRYFELRLRLSGDGTTTPSLRALRAYYPRFSYLEKYLPAVYRDDPVSASFLDRFLALFEGFFTSIEDRIAASQLLLDVRSAPPDALDWLAGFFGAALDPAWDDARRRLFLRHAADFFRWRGTIRGLRMALELAIARCPSEAIFGDRPASRREDVRVIEKFRTRRTPGVVLGDPTDLEGIRALPLTSRWKPEHGRKALVEAWRQALSSPSASFPIRRPIDGSAPIWTAFCRRVLGFVPSATDADQPIWADFLKRAGSDATTPLPIELPENETGVADWVRFEGVLAVRRSAHSFMVALPVPPSETGNAPDYQERRRLAERLIALEKPAHTVFEVKFYWAMFRVGDARVALDTQIHQGSRAPELLGPAVLGQSYLAEAYLAPRPPQDAADRSVLGRDPIRG